MPSWKAETLGKLTQEKVLLEPRSRFANSISSFSLDNPPLIITSCLCVVLIHTAGSFASFFLAVPVRGPEAESFSDDCSIKMMRDHPLCV